MVIKEPGSLFFFLLGILNYCFLFLIFWVLCERVAQIVKSGNDIRDYLKKKLVSVFSIFIMQNVNCNVYDSLVKP